jgi:hypothetical protein
MRDPHTQDWERILLALVGVAGSWGLQEVSYLAAIIVSLLTAVWIGVQIILALREDRRKSRLLELKESEFFQEQDK